MSLSESATCFEQVHIDVARNATDDFNPFHDKNRWRRVVGNPYPGPIVLGFQLECFIEDQMRRFRAEYAEDALIEREGLRYSNYQFKFAGAVKAGQAVRVDIRRSRFKSGEIPELANRVSLYADERLAMTGYKRESRSPAVLADFDPTALGDLSRAPDRSVVGEPAWFLKRKFMMTSNAKNFLCGSLVEQSGYIDEIDERVLFPETFPCALLSCALLESARLRGHDFERDPMVYLSHNISVDRHCMRALRSNDKLHIVVRLLDAPEDAPAEAPRVYECGVVRGDREILLTAIIELIALRAV